MKKIIIFIFLLFSITNISNADFGSVNSLDLYKNIDKGINKLQENIFEIELEGGKNKTGIIKEINNYAAIQEKPTCLDEEKKISIKEFNKILKDSNIKLLSKYLVPDCIKEQIIKKKRDNIVKKYLDLEDKIKIKANKKITNNDYQSIRKIRIQTRYEIRNNNIQKKIELKKLEESNIKESGKEWNNQLINILLLYSKLFKQYNKNTEVLSEIKADKIYKLSQIGIYSDGNINNSPFDLITDIEEIDKIIFKDVINYEGERIEAIDDFLDKALDPDKMQENINEIQNQTNNIIQNLGNNKKEDKLNYYPPTTINNTLTTKNNTLTINNIVDLKNNYTCKTDINTNGLSDDALNGLLNNIQNTLNNSNIKDNTIKDNTINDELNGDNNQNNSNNNEPQNENGDNTKQNGIYNKITDNSVWPCSSFFCIIIDFVTYEHNLFGGGENITIEYLLNRSNKHLGKFASTSLIPAKMGTNNFELGLKDLNLPDIFHLGFQVTTKPVPILNIEKQGTKDSKNDLKEFSSTTMIKVYYEAHGLDYKRRNDLDILSKLEANKQGANNSLGLTSKQVLEKQAENDKIVREKKKKLLTYQKAVEAKVSYGTIGTFEEQFIELDKFTTGILNYTQTLRALIRKLNKVPQG